MLKPTEHWVRAALASVKARQPREATQRSRPGLPRGVGACNDAGNPHEEEGHVAEDKQLNRTKCLGVAATGVAAAGSFGFAGYTGSRESEGS